MVQLRRAFEHHSGVFFEDAPLSLGLRCWVLVGALLFGRVNEIFQLQRSDFRRHVLEMCEDQFGDGKLRSWYDWNQLRSCKNLKGGIANMKKVTCTFLLTSLITFAFQMAKELVIACPGVNDNACRTDAQGNWIFCKNVMCAFRVMTKVQMMTGQRSEVCDVSV